MLISRFSVENFKGIGERVEIELKPVTLLFGPNSAGKSSIIHALHYACEVLEHRNLDADMTLTGGNHVNLGGFQSMVHRHDLNRTIWLRFDTEGNEELYANLDDGYSPLSEINEYLEMESRYETWATSFCSVEDAAIEIGIAWQPSTQRPYLRCYRVFFAGKLFAHVEWNPGNRNADMILRADHASMTTIADWVTDTSVAVDDADKTESCLARCLSACLQFFPRILSSADETAHLIAPIILSGPDSALPLPGRSFEIPVAELEEICSAEPGSSEYLEQERLHCLATEVAAEICGMLTEPLNLVTQYLQEFRYLGPIREVPSRNHRPQRSSDRFSGIHRQRWPSGIGAWDALYNEREELVADTSDWLASPDKLDAGVELVWKSYKELDLSDPLIVKLQSGRAFDDVEGAQLNLERLATGSRLCIMPLNSEIELQPNDVGVGIAQVLPVLVSALDDVDSFTAIEQPELHLHPRLQARLADVFLVSSHTSIHGFLLETHSEHLLLRIQRRIRECSQGKRELDLHIGRGSVAIYYVCQQEGQTKLLRMNLDDQGDFIEPWPDDFFEIDFFERFPDAR